MGVAVCVGVGVAVCVGESIGVGVGVGVHVLSLHSRVHPSCVYDLSDLIAHAWNLLTLFLHHWPSATQCVDICM